MDAIGGTGLGAMAATTQKQMAGAQVVSGTINQMNTNEAGQVNADHDFQTKVLSAAMGKGTQLDVSV